MFRFASALALTLVAAAAPLAQEAAPAPAAPEIQVDPNAVVDNTPKTLNLLTGIYATQAVIEICSVTVPEDVTERMTRDRQRYENLLLMDAPTAERAYASTKAEVEKTAVDCAEGSPDRQGVDAVLSAYQNV